MELTDGKLIEQTKRRQILARAIHHAMELRSDILGASLSVSYDARGNITFRMGVTETDIEDAELHALGELLEMTDAADIPMSQEIEGDFFHLVPFYQDFGFRLSSSQDHDDEISATEEARKRLVDHVSAGGLASDLVFTMHRKAWSSALVSPAEIAEIRGRGNPSRTPFHERAQQRDAILIALQKRGLTTKEAGYRISPNMTTMEVGMRNRDRRKQGWNVPSFRTTSSFSTGKD